MGHFFHSFYLPKELLWFQAKSSLMLPSLFQLFQVNCIQQKKLSFQIPRYFNPLKSDEILLSLLALLFIAATALQVTFPINYLKTGMPFKERLKKDRMLQFSVLVTVGGTIYLLMHIDTVEISGNTTNFYLLTEREKKVDMDVS